MFLLEHKKYNKIYDIIKNTRRIEKLLNDDIKYIFMKSDSVTIFSWFVYKLYFTNRRFVFDCIILCRS